MRYDGISTAFLIDKCVNGDPLAWAEFVRRYSPLIKFSIKKALSRYASYRYCTREDAKDIEQNIMASLWVRKNLAEIKNKNNIDYWLAVIARNATINYLKSRQKEILVSDKSLFEKLPSEEIQNKSTDIEKIEKIYKTLSAKEKLIFRLYFEKAFALKDIAKIMHIALGTVSSAVTRMRKKFRK